MITGIKNALSLCQKLALDFNIINSPVRIGIHVKNQNQGLIANNNPMLKKPIPSFNFEFIYFVLSTINKKSLPGSLVPNSPNCG